MSSSHLRTRSHARRLLRVTAISLLVMSVWPLLALLITPGIEDHDWPLFFGGATMIPAVLFMMVFGDIPEAALTVMMIGAWCLVWLAPISIPALRRSPVSGGLIGSLFILQSGFSLLQAALGSFMIIGREV